MLKYFTLANGDKGSQDESPYSGDWDMPGLMLAHSFFVAEAQPRL